MFSGKTIAAAAALVSGLAVTSVGATQAYAEGASSHCAQSALGNSTCIDKRQHVYTTKDGRYVVKQRKNCSSAGRHHVLWPESGLLNKGVTRVGPAVDCSNRAPAPKNFKLPHLGF